MFSSKIPSICCQRRSKSEFFSSLLGPKLQGLEGYALEAETTRLTLGRLPPTRIGQRRPRATGVEASRRCLSFVLPYKNAVLEKLYDKEAKQHDSKVA